MLWRTRTTLADQPGILAEIALACGRAGVNIVGMQVLATGTQVTDIFVVDAPEGWNDLQVAELFEAAGGSKVAVTRVGAGATVDSPTRWLDGARAVLDGDTDVEAVLVGLLDTEPPDVADYVGHDVLTLTRPDGSELLVSRAIPFTPVEGDRAQALVTLVHDGATAREPVPAPMLLAAADSGVPLVRRATLADAEAVAALHGRCSDETLFNRYRVPLQLPMTGRMNRRLVSPAVGLALVVQLGPDIVGHGLLEPVEDIWTFQLLVEDAHQGGGLGTQLVKHAAGRAKGLGAARLTFVTAGSNDKLLRTVGNAGFMARVERHDDSVHTTVPLRDVRAIETA
jgi:GNAT superfamily N-acetyltransferase